MYIYSLNLQYHTGVNVSWFGGEPLLAMDVISYLSENIQKTCNIAKKNYSAGITTNGYLLDYNTFDLLVNKYNVKKFQITIDGTENTHDNQRVLVSGGRTHKKIIDNLKEIKNSNARFFNILVRTNFTKTILDEIDEYLLLLSDLFGNDARFSFSISIASDWGGSNAKMFEDEFIDESTYPHIMKKFSEYNEVLNFENELENLMSLIGVCYANRRNSFVIGSDGGIYKCTAHFDIPQNQIGFLDKNGDMIIDEKKHSFWVFNNHISDEGCDECYFSYSCFGTACPYGNINDESLKNNCPRTHKYINSIMELLPSTYYQKIEEEF